MNQPKRPWLRRSVWGVAILAAGIGGYLFVQTQLASQRVAAADQDFQDQVFEPIIVEPAPVLEPVLEPVLDINPDQLQILATDQPIIPQTQVLTTASVSLASEALPPTPEQLQAARLDASRMFIGEARIGHNAPESMHFGERYDLELAFIPEGVEAEILDVLSSTLSGPIVEADGIAYTQSVQAVLEGGDDFRITPSGPQRRLITGDRPLRWFWQVEPQTFGEDRRLTFRLEALVHANDGYEVVAQETYRATVFVEVGWGDWFTVQMQRVEAPFVAIGGFITLLLAALTFYFNFLAPRRRQ